MYEQIPSIFCRKLSPSKGRCPRGRLRLQKPWVTARYFPWSLHWKYLYQVAHEMKTHKIWVEWYPHWTYLMDYSILSVVPTLYSFSLYCKYFRASGSSYSAALLVLGGIATFLWGCYSSSKHSDIIQKCCLSFRIELSGRNQLQNHGIQWFHQVAAIFGKILQSLSVAARCDINARMLQ